MLGSHHRADWDRRYGHQPYTIVWCTDGSKFNVNYFPISKLPKTQRSMPRLPLCVLIAPLRFSIFKVGLFKPGLDVLLGNPHTPSSLDTNRYKALEKTFYIFIIAMALLLQLLR